jgi:hypothetical protein
VKGTTVTEANPTAITDAIKSKLVEHNISSPNIDTDTLAGQIAGAVEQVVVNPPEVADGTPKGEPGDELAP